MANVPKKKKKNSTKVTELRDQYVLEASFQIISLGLILDQSSIFLKTQEFGVKMKTLFKFANQGSVCLFVKSEQYWHPA